MFDGLKFEPDPSCVRAGFRNRLYEGNDHTAETSTPRQCRALAGRCVLHPPHFAMLFLSAEPANSWIVGNPSLTRSWKGCSSSTKNGEGLLLQLKSAADFVRAVEWTAS